MNVENSTVYVVEDDQETRESFAALFKSEGLAVETFSSGEEFVRYFDSAKAGCLVTDFRLQGINGIALHRMLSEAGCTLPVILISGYLDVRATIEAFRQGVFRVIEKPYHENELISAVQEAIQLDCKAREKKTHRLDLAHRLQTLDARERLTLEMIVAGHGNRTIESRLGLSTRTVDRIRSSILEKTSFLSFMELSAAYGAVQAAGHKIVSIPKAGVGDTSDEGDSDERATECLCAGLLRIQAVLLSEGEISEDSRPLLRDAEVAIAKALGEIHSDKIPSSALGSG